MPNDPVRALVQLMRTVAERSVGIALVPDDSLVDLCDLVEAGAALAAALAHHVEMTRPITSSTNALSAWNAIVARLKEAADV